MVSPDKEDGDELPDKNVARDFYAKYEPKEILGKGVSSTVRKCIEKETGKEYAAKIIDISADTDDSSTVSLKEATLREISTLRLVAGHPFIIELHDVFESSTFIFLVFEICKNGELFDYLTNVVALSEKKTNSVCSIDKKPDESDKKPDESDKKPDESDEEPHDKQLGKEPSQSAEGPCDKMSVKEPASEKELRNVMKQLFEAVEFIHSKHVVHRDLKPENILLDDDFNIKLTDFGFAQVISPSEKLYDLCGTPGYLAPELLRASMYEGADGYGKEIDILVGFPPFWHRKQMVMLRNIMEGKYEFCSPEWDDITDLPKELIQKLLVVDPKRRISASEALSHNFFKIVTTKGRVFNARKTFQFGILCVRAMVRLKRLKYTPEPLSVDIAKNDPYRIKTLRKVIDGCAFRVYCHWVKKSEMQNRAALFENRPRVDLKKIYMEALKGQTA